MIRTERENLPVVLEALVGSRAQGLDRPDSDYDRIAIFVRPVEEILALHYNPANDHIHREDEKGSYKSYEVGRFIQLAAQGNPSMVEALWADTYFELMPVGQLLIDNRKDFLGRHTVTKAYLGYAKSQIMRAKNRPDDEAQMIRYRANMKATYRLLLQAEQLLTTGDIRLKLTKEEQEAVWEFADIEFAPAFAIWQEFDERLRKLENSTLPIPDEPNLEALSRLLAIIRRLPYYLTQAMVDLIPYGEMCLYYDQREERACPYFTSLRDVDNESSGFCMLLNQGDYHPESFSMLSEAVKQCPFDGVKPQNETRLTLDELLAPHKIIHPKINWEVQFPYNPKEKLEDHDIS